MRLHKLILTGLSAVAAAASFAAAPAQALPFQITQDVCTAQPGCPSVAPSYTGPGGDGSYIGAVSDGGNDAYDGYGVIGRTNGAGSFIYGTNLNGLTHTRQTESFASENIYRWFDTFTNNTGSTLNTSLRFYGNLGSDGSTTVEYSDPYHLVTGDTGYGDPLIAHVFGNNAFAANDMTAYTSSDWVYIDFNLLLNPGETKSLLILNYLTSTGDYIADAAAANTRALQLIKSPYLAGLSTQQISQIVNFGTVQHVPEPATLALFGMGLLGLGLTRRKRAS